MGEDMEDEILHKPHHRRESKLAKWSHHHKVLTVLCIISVCDALLVVGELTIDVLATKLEKQEVCDTKEILKFLRDTYPDELESLYKNHTVDEILDEIKEHNEAKSHHMLHHFPYKSIQITIKPGESRETTISPIRTTFPRSSGTSPPRNHNAENQTTYRPRTSAELFHIAHSLKYTSMSLLTAIFLVNIVRIAALGKVFFHSRLQTIDAIVVTVSLALDIGFLPELYVAHDATTEALPIIVGLSWRVVRVVNNSLINLKEKDNIQIKRVRSLLKASVRKNKHRKAEIINLKDLARKIGASEDEISSCSNTEKIFLRKRRSSVANALKAMTSISFGSPKMTNELTTHQEEPARKDSFSTENGHTNEAFDVDEGRVDSKEPNPNGSQYDSAIESTSQSSSSPNSPSEFGYQRKYKRSIIDSNNSPRISGVCRYDPTNRRESVVSVTSAILMAECNRGSESEESSEGEDNSDDMESEAEREVTKL